MSKKSLSERDICTQFITPAVQRAGWDFATQVREEVSFTKGRIIVRGKLVTRGKAKRADYLLAYHSNQPIALIEAKDNDHGVGDGMQQALEYAETLGVPFVFSSNGDAFLFHDQTGTGDQVETELSLDDFPSPQELWARYRRWKGLDADRGHHRYLDPAGQVAEGVGHLGRLEDLLDLGEDTPVPGLGPLEQVLDPIRILLGRRGDRLGLIGLHACASTPRGDVAGTRPRPGRPGPARPPVARL
jgi:hypothetical protein